MNSNPIESGKITWLSGPSSSGKTVSTRLLEAKGWIRIEADAELFEVRISLVKTEFLDKLTYLESHLATLTTANIMGAINGDVKPSKTPSNPSEYEKVRLDLLGYLKERDTEVSQALLIHMLDKAIGLSSLGKNVIIDHVPFINDPGFSSHKVIIDSTSTNLWCYRDFKIEQQLKYVPIETLMRNVIRRNCNPDPDEFRPMPVVLKQYSKRFVVSSNSDDEELGTLKVKSLKQWIERSVKINFFDINKNHRFIYDESESEDIDLLIQKRIEKFIIEMDDPDNATDPTGEKVDINCIKILHEKKADFPNLAKKIDEITTTIMENMKIPETAITVKITYASYSGIKPTIIRDF